ncbi:hypothetical protein BD309DRAFT_857580 [Dichomitus squalens]|nr:hypothetical protein BD309DRAFT_857580 [Dichomitus squalens]
MPRSPTRGEFGAPPIHVGVHMYVRRATCRVVGRPRDRCRALLGALGLSVAYVAVSLDICGLRDATRFGYVACASSPQHVFQTLSSLPLHSSEGVTFRPRLATGMGVGLPAKSSVAAH